MKKFYLSIVMLFVMLFFTNTNVKAHEQQSYIVDGLIYTIENNSATVIGYEYIDSTLVIPDTVVLDGNTYTVKSIECKSLRGCAVETLVLPSTLEKLGFWAFQYCDNLKSVTISSTIENSYLSFNYGPFEGCDNLSEINFTNNVTSLPSLLFLNCTGIKSVNMPDSITSLNVSIFWRCSNLEYVKLPKYLKEIPGGLFNSCTSLKTIILPENLVSVQSGAFNGCSSLKEIIFPKTLETISNCLVIRNTFKDCTSLENIYLGEEITAIPESCFENCVSLKSINIPSKVTTISSGAFKDCISLKDVYINKAVTNIDKTAFTNSPNVTIHCAAGSYAETFAKENGIKFVNFSVPTTALTLSCVDLNITNVTNKTVNNFNPNWNYKLITSVAPEDTTDFVTWSSSDETVAKVTDGIVKFYKHDSVTITATSGSKTASITFAVSAKNKGKVSVVTVKKDSDVVASIYTTEKRSKTDNITGTDSYTKTYKNNRTFRLNCKSKAKLSYKSSNTKVATVDEKGKVTLKGAGKCNIKVSSSSASKTVTLTVKPAKPAIAKLARKKSKRLKVTIKKDTMIDGYEIQYSTNKQFKNAKTIKLSGKVSYTIKKLKSKNRYFVRVRSYKKSANEKVYSEYSYAKTIKVK